MFLTPLDETVKRMGAELLFSEQLIAKFREELSNANAEIEKLTKLNKSLLEKVEVVNGDGYESERPEQTKAMGEIDAESLPGLGRRVDDRLRSYSNGGAAEAIQGDGNNGTGSALDTGSRLGTV